MTIQKTVMKRIPLNLYWLSVAVLISAAGCGGDSPGSGSAGGPASNGDGAAPTSPGMASAPVSLDYEVLGKPIVGLPVAINVQFNASGDAGTVSVRYSINDASSLHFQEGQVEQLDITNLAEDSRQQVTVVPQREGRLYLNVSAEVQMPGGAAIKSMAIPIQVDSSSQRP